MIENRLYRGVKSLNRISEVKSCISKTPDWLQIIPAYLGIKKLRFPFDISTRDGKTIRIADWWDLSTVWVVLFGNEYLLEPTDRTIVDLGANIGAFVIHACSSAPESHIIAIEPFPSTFASLQDCVRNNNLQSRVVCHQWAVAPEDGTVYMSTNPEIPSPCRTSINTSKHNRISIQGVCLETLFNIENLQEIDFLKIDIEGVEYELLSKANSDTLRCARRIGLEYHDNGDYKSIWNKLENSGFECTRHPKKGIPGVVEFTRKLRKNIYV
jgi:FkbM family methyltransferase